MKQLVLEVSPDLPPSFENFVGGDCGSNAILLDQLRHAVREPCAHVFIWGEHGCGRSHLLQACVAAAGTQARPAVYLPAAQIADTLPDTPGLLLAVDDLEQLGEAAQIALFNAFNRARALAQTLVLSASSAPLGLKLREDLRTRVGQSLAFQVLPLDDGARAAILATLAQRRGLPLEQDVINYLLRHGRRDLPSLLQVLDALDRASLERKRAITLPLLRELQQSGLQL